MKRTHLYALILVVAVTGCQSITGPTQTEISIQNNGSKALEVSVQAYDTIPEDARVEHENGTTRTVPFDRLTSLQPSAIKNVTVNRSAIRKSVQTVESNTNKNMTIGGDAEVNGVLYVVRDDNDIIFIVSHACTDTISTSKIQLDNDGVESSSYGCP
jgi:hypothetical protein